MESDGARGRTRPSILVGQLIASAFTAFFVTFFVAESAAEGIDGLGEFVLAIVLVAAAISVIVAWLDVSLGPRVLAAAGVAMAVFGAMAAGDSRVAVAVILGAPYLLSALAIWFGARRLAGGGPATGA